MKAILRVCVSLLFVSLAICSFQELKAQNVAIIESQTGNSWAVQDTIWERVAVDLGYNAKVVQQSALDKIDSLKDADILIVSSSNISFSGTTHLQTIIDFIRSGRPAYIQSEYTTSFQGNITFDSLMKVVGSPFHWEGTITGDLIPMRILSPFSETPDTNKYLNYFNYGTAGHGSAMIDSFLEFQGNFFGFYYHDSTSCNGAAITVSDEDWVWKGSDLRLMTNIMSRLVHSYNQCYTTTNKLPKEGEINVYPNPFSDFIGVNILSMGIGRFEIINGIGQIVHSEIISKNNFAQNVSIETDALPAGIYFVRIIGNNFTETKQMIKQ